MAELETRPTGLSVDAFLDGIADDRRRADALTLLEIMRDATGSEPKMWGSGIVGFGAYHYRYASGREGDWFVIGFSPRKKDLTLYLSYGFQQNADLMSSLGKYKTGKACLYIKRLEDVDLLTLRELVQRCVEQGFQASS